MPQFFFSCFFPSPKNLDAQLQSTRARPEKNCQSFHTPKARKRDRLLQILFLTRLVKNMSASSTSSLSSRPVKTLPIFNSVPGFAVWINLVTLCVERLASNRSTFVLGSFEGAAAFVKIQICRLGNVNPFFFMRFKLICYYLKNKTVISFSGLH